MTKTTDHVPQTPDATPPQKPGGNEQLKPEKGEDTAQPQGGKAPVTQK